MNLLAILLILVAQSFADTRYVQWSKQHDSSSLFSVNGEPIFVDNSQNVYITGAAKIENGLDDCLLVKYGADGDELWSTTFDGYGGADRGVFISEMSDGNIVVAGGTFGLSGPYWDILLLKFSPDGELLWNYIFADAEYTSSFPHGVAIGFNDEIFLTAEAYRDSSQADILTFIFNAEGENVWIDTLSTSGYDFPSDLDLDIDGNVYVAGVTQGPTSRDFLLMKYSPTGDVIWTRTYDSNSQTDDLRSMTIDYLGNIFVTGLSHGETTVNDYVTIKYTPNGEQAWLAVYDGPSSSFDNPIDITTDGFGNIYVTGNSVGEGPFEDILTVKYGPEGNELWNQRYSGESNEPDRASSVTVGPTGNVFVSGSTSFLENSSRYFKIYNAEYSDDGNLLWEDTFSDTIYTSSYSRCLKVDGSGNLYIAGHSIQLGYNSYVLSTIKYSTQTLSTRSVNLPIQTELSLNFPNPFNISTNIKYSTSEIGKVSIQVYDLQGALVKNFGSSSQAAGKHNISWNSTDLNGEVVPAGNYFALIQTESGNQVVKMTLVK